MYRRVPPPPRNPDSLAVLRRVTPRDRLLLSWLAEHYVLTADQIAAALFGSRRTAQMRLTILHRLDVLARFAFCRTDGLGEPYLYTLGKVGLKLHPTAWRDPDNPAAKAPRSHIERAERIAASPTRAHLLGVNQFFVDLHAHARTHPQARLSRWWSEQHASAAYADAGIHPDGHGVWTVDGHSVGFFLEHDRATENLARVVAKLRAYERLTVFGPRYPVLLWLPNRRREANLLRALTGVRTLVPVATAVHCDDPAGPIWALPAAPGPRLRLHELPSSHGPDAATNPHRFPDDPDGDDLGDDLDPR